MFTKIGEFFYFLLALVIGIVDLGTSGHDYSLVSYEYSKEYVEEHRDTFDALIEAMIDEGPLPETGSHAPGLNQVDNASFQDVKSKIKERAQIYFGENGVTVLFDFYGGSEGFPDTGLIYYENGNPGFAEGDVYRLKSAEWDEEYGCYVIYNSANYSEIYQIDENWYYIQKAFYNNDGFRTKE